MTTTITINRDSKLCDFTRDIVEPCLGPTQGIIPPARGVAAVKYDLGQDDPDALACLLVPEHHHPVAQLFLVAQSTGPNLPRRCAILKVRDVAAFATAVRRREELSRFSLYNPVSYTHLRAHETV